MALTEQIGVNPLPWLLGPTGFDRSAAALTAAVAGVAEAGFTAVSADVPDGMRVAEYQALLSDHGLRPSPGYIAGDFDGPPSGLTALLDAARAQATVQAELGLTEVFLASNLNPARFASPATGADLDPARLELVIERIAGVAAAITAEGVTPCFHPHVGTWIETEHEVRTLLDAVDPKILSFGPDTGHLFWAGADPAALISDYADRVQAVHLKDVHRSDAAVTRERGANYVEATFDGHVWTEPGRGDVDFEAVFKALPASYRGWFVIEVDVPDLGTKEESTAHSARWVLAQPELGVRA